MKTKKETTAQRQARERREDAKNRKAVTPSHGAKKDDGKCPDCTNPKCRITARIKELDGSVTICRYHGDAPDLRKKKDILCAKCLLMKVEKEGALCPACVVEQAEREEGKKRKEENQKRFVEHISEKMKRKEEVRGKPRAGKRIFPMTKWTRAFCADGKQTAATLEAAMKKLGRTSGTIKDQVARATEAGLLKK